MCLHKVRPRGQAVQVAAEEARLRRAMGARMGGCVAPRETQALRPQAWARARTAAARQAAGGREPQPLLLRDHRLFRGAIAVGPALRVSLPAQRLPLTCGQRRSGRRGAGSGWAGALCFYALAIGPRMRCITSLGDTTRASS
jgi:hypothetical protein